MGGEERVRRLRWLCRRGMKELDILLARFIDDNEPELAEGKWPGLEALLQTEDDRLWDGFQQPQSVEDPEQRALISEIRGGHA